MFSSTYCWILRWILHIGQSERGEGHMTVWDASNVVDCSMHCLGFGGFVCSVPMLIIHSQSDDLGWCFHDFR
jgi:hypothetical protein